MTKEIHLNSVSLRSLYIELYFGEQRLSSGTAFIAEYGGRKAIITNRHNVTGRDQNTAQPLFNHGGVPNEMRVWHTVKGGPLTWRPYGYDLLEGEKPKWLEHPSLGDKADIVAIPYADDDEIVAMPYDLSQAEEMFVRPADFISVVGFPFGKGSAGMLPIWASGFVASEPSFPYLDRPVTLIDSRTRPGQSGSPVVMQRNDVYSDLKGNLLQPYTRAGKTQLLGIYSGRIAPESDIGMVWWRSAIIELFDQVWPEPQRSEL